MNGEAIWAKAEETSGNRADDGPTPDVAALIRTTNYMWSAILAPAGTPRPIIDKLSAVIIKASGAQATN